MVSLSAHEIKKAFSDNALALKTFLTSQEKSFAFSIDGHMNLVFQFTDKRNEIQISLMDGSRYYYAVGVVDFVLMPRNGMGNFMITLKDKVIGYLWDNHTLDYIRNDEYDCRDALAIFKQTQTVFKFPEEPNKDQFDKALRGMRHMYIQSGYLNLWVIPIY